MGTVHLTNGHHGLYIRGNEAVVSHRVLLDANLLAQPILSSDGRTWLNNPYLGLVRGALGGLLKLHHFSAAVSFEVVLLEGEVPYLKVPHREWGEITLGSPDNVIVGFSHDTRGGNRPFRRMWQWVESEELDEETSDEEYARFCSEWSSSQKWYEFFLARIRRASEQLQSKAIELKRQTDGLTARREAIQAALDLE